MRLAAFLARLPIPILQAPMVGASTPAMALAVSRAGGLGAFGLGATPPDEIEPLAAEFRRQTDAPFGMNLFIVPPAHPSAAALDEALDRLRPWYDQLGAPVPEHPNAFAPDFGAQFAALVRAAPPVASFTFGILTEDQVRALQAAGSFVVGTATTVAEARAWQAVGADGVCVQGFEAGGHRGHFLDEPPGALVGTLALVATARDAVSIPVLAAGGIMDGAGVAAALALGADAVQMGTAFLASDQTGISAAWRAALDRAPDDPTRLTRAFTGRHARGVENRFMREMRRVEDEVPAYPVQNRLTQPLRAAAAKAGEADMLSLWAGQGVKLIRTGDAGDLVRAWWDEARQALQRLTGRFPSL